MTIAMKIAAMGLLVFGLLVGLEGVTSWTVVAAWHLPAPLPGGYAQYLAQPRYQTADGRAYWQEFAASTASEYVDGLMWRRQDFHGRFITVVAGERARGTDMARAAVFGGSAVWGTGVGDAETLPAQLGAHNYGEGGYVSTQDFLRFAALLRASTAITTAIFYQGLNDVQAGCIDPGVAGATLRYRTLQAQVERHPWALLRVQEGAARVGAWFAPPYHAHRCEPGDAKHVAETLTRTWALTDQLAAAHGIPALFVLQPVHSADPSYANVYRFVAPHVRRFLDLSQLQIPDEEWIDFAHVTAAGNRRIAAAIGAVW